MPAKDAARFVKIAAASTLFALPRESELIVIDDGSSDETLQILSQIRDPRLKVFRSNGNGISAALNFGLEKAQGCFVARMDADDICLPWRFRLQIRLFRNGEHVDFAFTPAIVFGTEIKPWLALPQIPWSLDAAKFRHILQQRNPAVHPTMMARASAIQSLGGYSSCPAEDEELWLRAALSGMNLVRTSWPGVALRTHAKQTTRQASWRMKLSMDPNLKELRRRLQQLYGKSEVQLNAFELHILNVIDSEGLSGFQELLKSFLKKKN